MDVTKVEGLSRVYIAIGSNRLGAANTLLRNLLSSSSLSVGDVQKVRDTYPSLQRIELERLTQAARLEGRHDDAFILSGRLNKVSAELDDWELNQAVSAISLWLQENEPLLWEIMELIPNPEAELLQIAKQVKELKDYTPEEVGAVSIESLRMEIENEFPTADEAFIQYRLDQILPEWISRYRPNLSGEELLEVADEVKETGILPNLPEDSIALNINNYLQTEEGDATLGKVFGTFQSIIQLLFAEGTTKYWSLGFEDKMDLILLLISWASSKKHISDNTHARYETALRRVMGQRDMKAREEMLDYFVINTFLKGAGEGVPFDLSRIKNLRQSLQELPTNVQDRIRAKKSSVSKEDRVSRFGLKLNEVLTDSIDRGIDPVEAVESMSRICSSWARHNGLRIPSEIWGLIRIAAMEEVGAVNV